MSSYVHSTCACCWFRRCSSILALSSEERWTLFWQLTTNWHKHSSIPTKQLRLSLAADVPAPLPSSSKENVILGLCFLKTNLESSIFRNLHVSSLWNDTYKSNMELKKSWEMKEKILWKFVDFDISKYHLYRWRFPQEDYFPTFAWLKHSMKWNIISLKVLFLEVQF